jgi:cytoskeletal protein CcmA (bactofilin family)
LTLAITLLTIALALTLGLVLSSASLAHLHFSRHSIRQVVAKNAAEAVLAEACERIVSDPEYGIERSASETLSLTLNSGRAFLSFNPSSAEDQDVPVSTSNRFGIDPEAGWQGSIIPPHSVQLYAQGECEGTVVVLEAVIAAPEFPYVVASSGPIESQGALTIGMANSLEDILSAEELRSSALSSNGPIALQGQASIWGNVASAAQIDIGSSVTVNGELRPNSELQQFEDIDILSLRPTSSIPLSNTFSPTVVDRFHHNGPTLEILGGLTLDDGVLFVNGDTSIRGGITGKGAIVVNGDLTIEGSSSLVAENQIALVTQGDLRVLGRGPNSSFFQGLVYTEGDFFAEDVTLVGAFLANKPQAATEPGSQFQLRNASVIQLSEYGKFDLDAVPYLIWNDGQKESQGGREVLNLLQVDEKDIPVLESAVTVEREGEGIDGNGGSPTWSVTVDFALVASVARGRRASLQDGKLISDWEELTPEQIVEVLGLTQPPFEQGTETAPTASLALLGFEADPDSAYWGIAHSSFHFDLNEFLGTNERLRFTSWRSL